MNPLITLVIPNCNGCHLLEACLASVSAQTFSDYQVVLVDNGSTDGSAEYVYADFPWGKILANTTNLGFAPAVNRAVRESRPPLIATLNDQRLVISICSAGVRTGHA